MESMLTLVNSTMCALPTYAMCTMRLLISIINTVDRAGRDCLWKVNDVRSHGIRSIRQRIRVVLWLST
jgi:hypothetical protein